MENSLNYNYTIGRINFGPREAFTTLGQLIDDISAQEEIIEDLCQYSGELLSEIEQLSTENK